MKQTEIRLGLNPWAADSTSCDIFGAVPPPGHLILLISWKDNASEQAYEDSFFVKDNARGRRGHAIRD
jgi:hypothetical protein